MPLMGIPSISELIIIFGVIFLLFGAKKLPELGGAIGESIKNFKKGIRDDDHPAPTAATRPPERLPEASATPHTVEAAKVDPSKSGPVDRA